MSYPPYPPDQNRPQDTPRDQPGQQPGQEPGQQPGQQPGSTPSPGFPTYGRPEQPARQQNPYDRPQDPAAPFVPPSSPVQGSPYQGPQYSCPQYPGSPYQGAQYQMPPQGPQYLQQYGYGYQGIQQVKTNGLAVAALVCGLAAIFISITAPVAIGLGIAALVQIKRRRESGTAQAVIGLSLGSLITLGWAVILIFVIAVDWNEGSDYGSDPVSSYSASPDTTYVDDLAVGECFDDGVEEAEVIRQPCPNLHDGEVISNVTLPPGAYPGDAKVKEAARTACRQEFTKYVGISPDKSVRRSSFWYPDEDFWQDGDRLVVCAAYGSDGDRLSGSVKGTKR